MTDGVWLVPLDDGERDLIVYADGCYAADDACWWDEPDYAQWDPDVFPPPWYGCAACNAHGYDPYGTICTVCEGTGIRKPWRRLVFAWRRAWGVVWRVRHGELFHRCWMCGRWEVFLGVWVGDHAECGPF